MTAASDDGYIKYTSERCDGLIEPSAQLDSLNQVRSELFNAGLVGVYPDGVGYGNVSIRAKNDQFVISASATGSSPTLQSEQFCLVESFSVTRNHVRSRGPLPASSESMTHGAIYAANQAVHCVLHVHNQALFIDLLQQGTPATPANVAYGTPAMADAVTVLVKSQSELPVVFAMAGHADGVVAYGADLMSTLALLLAMFQRTQKS
jgi:ribulose-5-phosphate 4-epimerase/fuculose-1-phosphate aldolase